MAKAIDLCMHEKEKVQRHIMIEALWSRLVNLEIMV